MRASLSVHEVAVFVVAVAGGAFLWTLLEYVLHRFGGHHGRFGAAIRREHMNHHARPDTFSTMPRKLLLAVPTLSTLFVLVLALSTGAVAAGVTLGTTVAWLGYERLHRLVHVRAPRNAWGAWARRHHLFHHFNPRVNHGVTTPLWDWVFGTLARPDVVLVPRRQASAFPWLLDEQGVLAARWVDEYRLA